MFHICNKLGLVTLTLLAALMAAPIKAVELGDDGLHKPTWLRETFKDLRDDLEEATAEGRRLMLIVEQRGCIYCTQMHEQVFTDPAIENLIKEHFFVVQLNLFGDVEVMDFDGTVLPEKDMLTRWGVLFTPTLIFLPEAVDPEKSAVQASVASMPGAFGKATTEALLKWVHGHGYESGEHFQRYLARQMGQQ